MPSEPEAVANADPSGSSTVPWPPATLNSISQKIDKVLAALAPLAGVPTTLASIVQTQQAIIAEQKAQAMILADIQETVHTILSIQRRPVGLTVEPGKPIVRP